MLAELKAAQPDLNIELVGINLSGLESGNEGMTALCTFPWLQDVASNNVWAVWQATKDDLFIVDSLGRQQSLFRIGEHDLTYSTNRQTLYQLLLAAAVIRDSDGDHLPDDWRQKYFGAAAVKPSEDPDGDGRDNFTEYAFGTNPNDPKSALPMQVNVKTTGLQQDLSIVFHRRAGSVLNYYLESSTNLVQWSAITPSVATVSTPRNLFDGTGTSEVRVTLKPAPGDPQRWVRVRAIPR
jgi:hypothetical protein